MEAAIQQSRDNRIRVCAIIPAYNEAKTIAEIVQRAKKYVDTVFVVDDGSSDETAEIARQNGAQVIKSPVNRGIGATQQSGYNAAISSGFDYVIQLDSDGQHDPKYIPEILEVAQRCDMVIASRFLNSSHTAYPFVRRLGISFFTLVVNLLTHASTTDTTSGYRAYRTESLKKLGQLPNRHWAVWQTLEAANKGLSIKEVSVEMPVRDTGNSQFSFRTYGLYPFRMVWIIVRFILWERAR
jgi:glycosyltransferase involved in cell wall biosynthesis